MRTPITTSYTERASITTSSTPRPGIWPTFLMTEALDFLMTEDDDYLILDDGIYSSYSTRPIITTSYS